MTADLGNARRLAAGERSPCETADVIDDTMRPWRVLRVAARLGGLVVLTGALVGCARTATRVEPIYPEATVYDRDPQFIGEWVGEVGGVWGILTLGELEPHRYFGSFTADDGSVEYVLMLEQSLVRDDRGAEAPSNRVTFTWQDGLGGRGRGWLLVNREDTALTGSYGYDNAVQGLGDWTLMRSDT